MDGGLSNGTVRGGRPKSRPARLKGGADRTRRPVRPGGRHPRSRADLRTPSPRTSRTRSVRPPRRAAVLAGRRAHASLQRRACELPEAPLGEQPRRQSWWLLWDGRQRRRSMRGPLRSRFSVDRRDRRVDDDLDPLEPSRRRVAAELVPVAFGDERLEEPVRQREDPAGSLLGRGEAHRKWQRPERGLELGQQTRTGRTPCAHRHGYRRPNAGIRAGAHAPVLPGSEGLEGSSVPARSSLAT
jgi:hypothetical protein